MYEWTSLDITLRETGQTQRGTHSMFPFLSILRTGKTNS